VKDFFAGIGDQHDFPLHHVNELIFRRMPMPLTRPGTGGKACDIHSELRQPGGVPEAAPKPPRAGFVKRRRITRAGHGLGRVHVDFLRHSDPPS
jgi:hypothetical protein